MDNRAASGGLTVQQRVIRKHRVDPTQITGDPDLLRLIADDLAENGGLTTPTANWLRLDAAFSSTNADSDIRESFTYDQINKRMSSMDLMMSPWLGRQSKPAEGEPISRYASLMRSADPLNLWKANVDNTVIRSQLIEADLGTILDLNIIYSFVRTSRTPVRLLDLGGGYGRIAEAALNVFGGTLKCVMVDSVPGSLVYAFDYLREACPEASIGSYYNGDTFDLDSFDCYIVPSWRFEELNTEEYDVCCNVESFQEMSQDLVDEYLRVFDRVAADNAMIYISNAHDYIFRGQWNYPKNWEQVLCSVTPRSWTADHRTEVFIKRTGDYSFANEIMGSVFEWSLDARATRIEFSKAAVHLLICQFYRRFKRKILISFMGKSWGAHSSRPSGSTED